jgi:metal-responsive CopG/Arc/MetJ family transcriptional regulator
VLIVIEGEKQMKNHKTVKFLLSMDSEMLRDIDKWARQEKLSSRSEFIRHIFKAYVDAHTKQAGIKAN